MQFDFEFQSTAFSINLKRNSMSINYNRNGLQLTKGSLSTKKISQEVYTIISQRLLNKNPFFLVKHLNGLLHLCQVS